MNLRTPKITKFRRYLIRKIRAIGYFFREKRNKRFKDYINYFNKPVTILDIGGTEFFWWKMNFFNKPKVTITIINLFKQKNFANNIKTVVGDGRRIPRFNNRQFDVVFSNSVIEHLGSFRNQLLMAKEIQRVGKAYFVQTPYKFFIIEPHFLLPFFYLIPATLKPFLVHYFSLRWGKRAKNIAELKKVIGSIRLLTKADLIKLFPDAVIHEEKFLWMTKSFIVYKM